MSDLSLRMEHVYKKFSRGERHDSLRDMLPALAKRLMRRITAPSTLKKEEFWALKDVSFEVHGGEAVGIIGHNGAGKSTMLKHLSGIMRPTMGKIEVHGRLSALIEVGAGFHPDLTGRENIFLNGVILGMSRAEIRSKLDEIVAFSGLEEFIDTPVKRYSSGMYARLGFSVAAHIEPDVLVVDEVLSVGDFAFQAKSLEKMRSILRGGATVIFVSHNLRAVTELCPRTLLLNHGELIQDGPTHEVINTYMEEPGTRRAERTRSPATIETVRLFGARGARLDYGAGEEATVEVSVRAAQRCGPLTCLLCVLDDRHVHVFDVASDVLGHHSLELEAGETCVFRFRLQLHLAPGSYHVAAIIGRLDAQQEFDRLDPAATLLMRSAVPVRGAANLYPTLELVRHAESRQGPPSSIAAGS
ncbi:MAG TPA: ABC transporter ATP-binding protein [Steroidobacteraceae bacterium]